MAPARKRSTEVTSGDRTGGVDAPPPHYISKAEGAALLDRQARKYLNMSGQDFRGKYRSGELRDADHPDVTRVSFLIPLAED